MYGLIHTLLLVQEAAVAPQGMIFLILLSEFLLTCCITSNELFNQNHNAYLPVLSFVGNIQH